MKHYRVTVALEGIVHVPDDVSIDAVTNDIRIAAELQDERTKVDNLEYFVAHIERVSEKGDQLLPEISRLNIKSKDCAVEVIKN